MCIKRSLGIEMVRYQTTGEDIVRIKTYCA